jgi:hypothetical protein
MSSSAQAEFVGGRPLSAGCPGQNDPCPRRARSACLCVLVGANSVSGTAFIPGSRRSTGTRAMLCLQGRTKVVCVCAHQPPDTLPPPRHAPMVDSKGFSWLVTEARSWLHTSIFAVNRSVDRPQIRIQRPTPDNRSTDAAVLGQQREPDSCWEELERLLLST